MRTAGRVELACDAPAGRSRLSAVRYEGLSRSSRAFAVPGGGIRVMLSTLGPGVLGGDRFELTGRVAASASLVAAGQMATPIFAGRDPSASESTWHVAAGATLVIASEPLLLEGGSRHAASTRVEIAGNGIAVLVDTFALRDAAQLAMRTHASIDGALVYRDAFDIAEEASRAYGTVALVAADSATREAFAANALAFADDAVRIGVGETAHAVVIRLSGERVWDVRRAGFALAGLTAA